MCSGHTFPSGTAIRGVLGWGGEGLFQVRHFTERCVFCVREVWGGGFVRTVEEDNRERKTCWVHRVELHVSVPWGNGFRGILRCVYRRERRAANGDELKECE